MNAYNSKINVKAVEDNQVFYEVKQFLFFTWKEIQRVDTLGVDIVINSEKPIRNVYVNGKRYELPNTK